jgi:hypothetical protein
MRHQYAVVVESANSRQPTANSFLLSAVSCELSASGGGC